MDNKQNINIPVPDDLDEVIRRGISRGREVAARRRRIRQTAVRSVCALGLVMGLFVGGINLSPAFAAAVSDIPVIGQLVRVFAINQPTAQGGNQAGEGSAAVTMERDGDTEWMRLTFQQADASLYQVEFASYPKTVTITLPGTTGVEILSEISRARDTSQYIKSVWQLPLSTEKVAVIQLELESDADVQIREYRDPGGLVIQLTPTEIRLDTVYSLRTLSYREEEIGAAAERYASQASRVLRDDCGTFFVELAQYDTQETAEEALNSSGEDLIVERRTGNNVPVAFDTMEAYQSSRFLDEYYEVLVTSFTVEPVLAFMDQHFAQASREEQDTMLRGLSGLLEDVDEEEEVDWEKAASFYLLAEQEVPEYVRRNIQN